MKITHPSHLLALVLAWSLVAQSALAAPGDLDLTFDTDGKVTTSIGSGFDTGNSMALQSDGKVIVAGYFFNGSNFDVSLVRYNADGTLDDTFGGDGRVTTPIGSLADYGSSVAVQSDGKIVVAGHYSNGSNEDFAALRYNEDGTLDGGFGTGGKVTTPIGSGHDYGASVAVQSDGKIVVAGYFSNGGNEDFAVVRYTASGGLDGGFGTGGKVTTPIGGDDTGHSVVVQSDGKIVVAGTSHSGSNRDFAVVRYNEDGTLDSGFGTGGKVTTPIGSGDDGARSMVVLSDGRIVVAGASNNGSNDDFAVVRYTASGLPDPSFGTGGMVTTPIGSGDDRSASVAVQSDGKIVVAGGSSGDFAVVRYTFSGALDGGFGTGGTVTTPIGNGEDGAEAVAVQSDGKIIAAGASHNGSDFDLALVRYEGGEGPLQPLAPPVFDTTTVRGDGAIFLAFGAPAVDGSVIGGAASVRASDGTKQTYIYDEADGEALAQTGGLDLAGATFTALGDPVFAGEALGFAGTARLAPTTSPLLRMEFDTRLFAVKPGGKVAALYSQLTAVGGIRRLAAQADPAPGGGQFAKFKGFGLPRSRTGLVFTGNLHRSDGVTAENDFGIWREKTDGSGTEKLLRTGDAAGRHTVSKLTVMPPVPNATDQRLSFAPDGGVAVAAKFEDGGAGVVTVIADGSVAVAVDTASDVPNEAGAADASMEFVRFVPPATASGGRLAFVAALRAIANGRPAPAQSIFSNRGGTMRRVLSRGDEVPGGDGLRFGALGQPLMGEKGMIGLIAALTGRGTTPTTRKAVVRIDDGTKTVVARLGDQVPGLSAGVVYRRFLSMVVTDSDPARVVFTATIAGRGVNASNNLGLFSHSVAFGTQQLTRKGNPILANGQTLTVRTFEALQGPKKSQGQGRSTDASGFVTAKAKLSDGRTGVLRIALP